MKLMGAKAKFTVGRESFDDLPSGSATLVRSSGESMPHFDGRILVFGG